MKLGIFGGTFNPIHLGHLLIAQDACEAFGLDQVLFIPCDTPPHKVMDYLADSHHRLAMVRLAIRGNPSFACSDVEIRRGGVSYTVDTVRALLRKNRKAQLHLVIGSDSLNDLHQWREAAELVKLCRVIAVLRPGEKTFQFNRSRLRGLRPLTLRAHPFDVSSSEIRRRLREKKTIHYLVPEAVVDYIAKNSLYQKRSRKS